MKINSLHLFFISTILTSCASKELQKKLTSSEIIQHSVEFHDPQNVWQNFNQTLHFESSFSFNDSIPEALELTFQTAKNYFHYINHDRKVDMEYYGDSCIQHSVLGNCNGYAWTSRFYPYIWGLPMKLQDPGIFPESDYTTRLWNNDSVYEVQINYTAENYWFYFNQKDFQLRGFKFIKNDPTQKGEIVVLKGLKEINTIKFPQHRTWLHLDSSLIGTNRVID